MDKDIIVLKTKRGLFSKKEKVAFSLSENGLGYNSTLGNLGLISWEEISSIVLEKFQGKKVIKISVNNINALKPKMSRLKIAMTDVYKEKTGAEIVIFPQDVDMSIEELYSLLKKFK